MKIVRWALVSALLAGVAQPALAQSETGSDTSADEADNVIMVTAQRREENVQDVPIAINVLSEDTLAQANATGLLDLATLVPSLDLKNSAGFLVTSLRGVGSTAKGPGVENPIALYVDGVYMAAAGNSLLSLNNISQIAVLRGPQGTLFGRNATGGLIQITTRDPQGPTSGRFDVSFDNYSTLSGQAYIGGDLSENVAADIAATATWQGDGWGTNLFNGEDIYKVDHDFAVRSKWVFTPGADTKLTLIGDYAEREDSMIALYILPGTQSNLPPLGGGSPVDPLPGIDPYDINTDSQPFSRNWTGGASLQIDQQLGSVSLMSVTAWRKGHSAPELEFDGTVVPGAFVIPNQSDEQLTQELQLSSGDDGPFKWVTGVYYFHNKSAYDPFDLFTGRLASNIVVEVTSIAESWAGYAQGSLELGTGTTVTLGGRYTTEERKVRDAHRTVIRVSDGAVLAQVPGPDLEAKFDKFTFRVSLDQKVSEDVLAYASFNRGFKSGGFNINVFGSAPYQPEVLDAYEVGLKSVLADGKLTLNLAGFYYDYTDIQVQRITAGATTVINGGAARIYGVEGDFQADLSDRFSLSGGFSIMSPKYTSFVGCPTGSSTGGVPAVPGDCTDNQFQMASKLTFNLAANYEVPIGSDALQLNANLYYNDGYFLQPDNAIRQDSHALVGASATYEFDNGFSLGAFVKNLTNERVLGNQATSPEGNQMFYLAPPRIFGVKAGYSF